MDLTKVTMCLTPVLQSLIYNVRTDFKGLEPCDDDAFKEETEAAAFVLLTSEPDDGSDKG